MVQSKTGLGMKYLLLLAFVSIHLIWQAIGTRNNHSLIKDGAGYPREKHLQGLSRLVITETALPRLPKSTHVGRSQETQELQGIGVLGWPMRSHDVSGQELNISCSSILIPRRLTSSHGSVAQEVQKNVLY